MKAPVSTRSRLGGVPGEHGRRRPSGQAIRIRSEEVEKLRDEMITLFFVCVFDFGVACIRTFSCAFLLLRAVLSFDCALPASA
jgi:hypothetical protein